MHQGNHPCFAQAGVHCIDAADLEAFDHTPRGVDLFKAQFRVGVQIAAERGQLRMKGGNVRKRTAVGQGGLKRQT